MSTQDNRPADATPPTTDGPARARQALRRRAEVMAREHAAQLPKQLEAVSPEAREQTLHERRAGQIELEMAPLPQ